MDKVLFVNSTREQCGVHQYGKSVCRLISESSEQYQYEEFLCDSEQSLKTKLNETEYVAIVYNYNPSTLPWIHGNTQRTFAEYGQVGIVHEPFHPPPFQVTISQDPSSDEVLPHGLKQHSRPIFDYTNNYPLSEVPVIGSFGFGFADKGFLDVVRQVRKEFKEATMRLHLAPSFFGDRQGKLGKQVVAEATKILRGSGVKLEWSHDFLSIDDLVDWLAKNTINVFFYEYKGGRGISGVTDYAMSARRPVLLTKSYMFKHLWDADIFTDTNTIQQAINKGLDPLVPYYTQWTPKQLAKDYDRAVDISRRTHD